MGVKSGLVNTALQFNLAIDPVRSFKILLELVKVSNLGIARITFMPLINRYGISDNKCAMLIYIFCVILQKEVRQEGHSYSTTNKTGL